MFMGSLIELSAVSSVVIALLLVFVFPLFLVLTVLLDAVICELGYLDWLDGNNKFRRYIVSLLLYAFSLIGLIVLASGYTNQNAVYRD